MTIVKRMNRSVMRHLRNIVFDKQLYDNWSLMLPFTNRILRFHNAFLYGNVSNWYNIWIVYQLNRGILSYLKEKEVDRYSAENLHV